eukprot:3672001-Rhodomonas_salina.2
MARACVWFHLSSCIFSNAPDAKEHSMPSRGYLQRIVHACREWVAYGDDMKTAWHEGKKLELIKQNSCINLPYVIDGDFVITQSNTCALYCCALDGKGGWGGLVWVQGVHPCLFVCLAVYVCLSFCYCCRVSHRLGGAGAGRGRELHPQPPGAGPDDRPPQRPHEGRLPLRRSQDQGPVPGGCEEAHGGHGDDQLQEAGGDLQGAVHVRGEAAERRLCAVGDAGPAPRHLPLHRGALHPRRVPQAEGAARGPQGGARACQVLCRRHVRQLGAEQRPLHALHRPARGLRLRRHHHRGGHLLGSCPPLQRPAASARAPPCAPQLPRASPRRNSRRRLRLRRGAGRPRSAAQVFQARVKQLQCKQPPPPDAGLRCGARMPGPVCVCGKGGHGAWRGGGSLRAGDQEARCTGTGTGSPDVAWSSSCHSS